METNRYELLAARRNLTALACFEAELRRRRYGFGWTPTSAAPTTTDELLTAWCASERTRAPLPVSNLHCDSVIFLNAEANYCMRFWHDSSHVEHDLTFADDDEYELAALHLATATAAGYGPRTLEWKLLRADTEGETRCGAVLGRFPTNQLRFALWVVEVGIEEAIAYEFAAHELV